MWAPLPGELPRTSDLEDLVIAACIQGQPGNVESMLELLRAFCAADDCEIFLRDPERPEVVLAGCVGRDSDAFFELTRIPIGAGYPGGVTARQQPMFTNNFQKDQTFLRHRVQSSGIRAFLGLPLADRGVPLGYIGIGWHDASISIERLIPRLERSLTIFLARLPDECRHLPAIQESTAPLAVRCFGPMQVLRAGTPLPATAFVRRRALTLLKLLLIHAPRPVHQDVLIESLWPDSRRDTASNRLHGVVYALRQAIGSDAVVGSGEHYAFNTRAPHFVDLLKFRALLAEASTMARSDDPSRRMRLLEAAVALHRGTLFEADSDLHIFAQHRARLDREHRTAVSELLALYRMTGRHQDAEWLARRHACALGVNAEMPWTQPH